MKGQLKKAISVIRLHEQRLNEKTEVPEGRHIQLTSSIAASMPPVKCFTVTVENNRNLSVTPLFSLKWKLVDLHGLVSVCHWRS